MTRKIITLCTLFFSYTIQAKDCQCYKPQLSNRCAYECLFSHIANAEWPQARNVITQLEKAQ